MSHHRLTHPVALALTLAALAAPATAGAATDPAERALHLRSQALNDRYVLAETTDAAELAAERSAPVASPASGGIDWTDAGIGAGGMLIGLSVLSLSTYAVMQRRSAGHARRQTTTAA